VSTERKIESLIEKVNFKGKTISKQIREIPDFPFEHFSDLIEGIKSRHASLLRHSLTIEASIFAAVGDRNEKIFYFIGQALSWGAIPLGLILAVLVSWWLLIVATFVYFFGKRIVSDTYNKSIFRSAMKSEQAFCFLYHHNQISIGLSHDKSIHYYKNS
jgi:hypothetical protein